MEAGTQPNIRTKESFLERIQNGAALIGFIFETTLVINPDMIPGVLKEFNPREMSK